MPNTCYLLTEWRHLYFRLVDTGWPQKAWHQPRYYADMAYWTFFFQAYSAAGLLAMTLAIRPIARLCARHGIKFLYLEPALFVMMSIAVYLGLIVRLNSWNVVTHPWIVAWHVLVIPIHPVLSLTVVLFAGYLLGVYHVMDLLVVGVVGERRKVRAVNDPSQLFRPFRPGLGNIQRAVEHRDELAALYWTFQSHKYFGSYSTPFFLRNFMYSYSKVNFP